MSPTIADAADAATDGRPIVGCSPAVDRPLRPHERSRSPGAFSGASICDDAASDRYLRPDARAAMWHPAMAWTASYAA